MIALCPGQFGPRTPEKAALSVPHPVIALENVLNR